MSQADIREGDLVLLPTRGGAEPRYVLVIEVRPAILKMADTETPISSPDGEPFLEISYLSNRGELETNIFLARELSLTQRNSDEAD